MNGIHTRYQFSSYSMFEYKDIEDTLAEMAAKGWRIEQIGSFMCKYREMEPTNRKFFVAYPSEIEQCYEKGWKKEIQWKEMQIFSTEAEEPLLEMGEASRVNNACLAMNKSFIPNLRIAFFLLATGMVLNSFKMFGDSITYDKQTVWTFLCTACVTIICGVRLLNYSIWGKNAKRCIAQGRDTHSTKRSRQVLNILQIVFSLIFMSCLLQLIG